MWLVIWICIVFDNCVYLWWLKHWSTKLESCLLSSWIPLICIWRVWWQSLEFQIISFWYRLASERVYVLRWIGLLLNCEYILLEPVNFAFYQILLSVIGMYDFICMVFNCVYLWWLKQYWSTKLESWLLSVEHSATSVARCNRAMLLQQLLCTINRQPLGPCAMQFPLVMLGTPLWLGGSSLLGCSIWPHPWLPLAMIIDSCLISSCRYNHITLLLHFSIDCNVFLLLYISVDYDRWWRMQEYNIGVAELVFK